MTEDFIFVYLFRLILFTYIEPINLIGFLVHRKDDKQLFGYSWNPYNGKVYTLKD